MGVKVWSLRLTSEVEAVEAESKAFKPWVDPQVPLDLGIKGGSGIALYAVRFLSWLWYVVSSASSLEAAFFSIVRGAGY